MNDMTTSQRDQSVRSAVEVAVAPEVAFAAFTQELDLWWVRGPINHWAAGRMRELRLEPRVGGRLLEVYDDSDSLELARITVWEPSRRLEWKSSLDDVTTEVRFDPAGAGTLVTVVARVAAGGRDSGGSTFVRVVPKWFGPWCARRDSAPRKVVDLCRLALTIHYARPAAAARWLADAFGFESPDPLPEGKDPLPDTEHGHPWIEFRIGNGSLVLMKREESDGAAVARSHVPWVYVKDIEAHYRHAQSRGAKITQPLENPWGLPFYTSEDLEGHRWTFAQARPTML